MFIHNGSKPLTICQHPATKRPQKLLGECLPPHGLPTSRLYGSLTPWAIPRHTRAYACHDLFTHRMAIYLMPFHWCTELAPRQLPGALQSNFWHGRWRQKQCPPPLSQPNQRRLRVLPVPPAL